MVASYLLDTRVGEVQAINGIPINTSKLVMDSGTKTAAATSGAATLNKMSGVITTEALTTATGATYTLTLTNSDIAAADLVFVSVGNGTNTAGAPALSIRTLGVRQCRGEFPIPGGGRHQSGPPGTRTSRTFSAISRYGDAAPRASENARTRGVSCCRV